MSDFPDINCEREFLNQADAIYETANLLVLVMQWSGNQTPHRAFQE